MRAQAQLIELFAVDFCVFLYYNFSDMKKVVSIIVCRSTASVPTEPDGAEILYTEENRGFAEIVQNAIKQAKGKYLVLCGKSFEFADLDGLLAKTGDSNADIIAFDGATAFKSALFKGILPNGDKSTADILAILSAKSIEKSGIKPLKYENTADNLQYSESVAEELSEALKEFKRCKSKLPKEVYTFAVDTVCTRLNTFYAEAMLAVKNKQIPAEALTEFDALMKENVVLYLAMDKRFTPADLGKLRKKNFEISFITAKKFEKFLKKSVGV